MVPQLLYDGVPQPLNVIALDGVPVGTPPLGSSRPTSLFMPSARRAELIIQGPDASVADARLVTLNVNTGPTGDRDPARPLVQLVTFANATAPAWRMPVPALAPKPLDLPAPTVSWMYNVVPNATRRLFFSQDRFDPENPLRPVTDLDDICACTCLYIYLVQSDRLALGYACQINFYLTLDGQIPRR